MRLGVVGNMAEKAMHAPSSDMTTAELVVMLIVVMSAFALIGAILSGLEHLLMRYIERRKQRHTYLRRAQDR